MIKLEMLLFLVLLAFAAASLTAHAAAEGCAACSAKVPDWTETATDFLNGKVPDNTPQAFGPKAARMKNDGLGSGSGSDRDLLGSDSGEPEAVLSPAAGIDLLNISAMPNPADAGSAIRIVAVFGEKSGDTLQSRSADGISDSRGNASAVEGDTIAWVHIRDRAGREVGKSLLEPISKGEYAGVWNATVGAGTYALDVMASGRGGSVYFNDSMQLDIE